jgi:Ca-activated chloride channel family protein
MKYKTRILGSLIFAASMFLGNDVCAQPERDTDKTLSPYFFVKSDDPEVDQLPLKSTSVKVDISGVWRPYTSFRPPQGRLSMG